MRSLDVACRQKFFSIYKVCLVKYFEEKVFPDTTITVAVVAFIKLPATISGFASQNIKWQRWPQNEEKNFTLSSPSWLVASELYDFPKFTKKIKRYVKEGEKHSNITLQAVDIPSRKIGLYYSAIPFIGKISSRSQATLVFENFKLASANQQKDLVKKFNEYIKEQREKYWSLFLPSFREYDRKRIPFDLAYKICLKLIE
jgi:hypothetical protein